MSEPTEPPSPRKLRAARARGDVATSPALTGSAALLGGLAALAATIAGGGAALAAYARDAWAQAAAAGAAGPALRAAAALAVRLALPVLVAAALAAALVGFLQVGPLWATARPRARWGVALGGAARAALRTGALLVVAVVVLRGRAAEVVWLGRLEPGRQAVVLAGAALGLLLRVALVLAAFGLVELVLARRAWLRRLGMTRHELLRELRETEGDPAHRRERERVAREAAQEIDDADVRAAAGALCVIAGERLAVALRWDGRGAPVVVARGRALLAARVRQAARQAAVPIYVDDALARGLWLALGSEAPPELWDAVAQTVRRAMAA